MFNEESQARADELLRLYGMHPGPFVLTKDGMLGLMIGPNFHEIQGGQNVQIGVSDSEATTAAIEKAKAQDAADLAAFRAAKPAAPTE